MLELHQDEAQSPTQGTRQRIYVYVCGICQDELRIWREGDFAMTAAEADSRARKAGWRKTKRYGWVETRCESLHPKEYA